MKKQYTTRSCNKCKLRKCNCRNVIINKPVEVKASQAGNDGLDNYELALLEGFVGTRQEYLDSLKGGDGNSIEIRYAKNTDPENSPSIVVTDRVPSGWSLTAPSVGIDEYLWEAKANVSLGVPSELLSDWQVYRSTGVSSQVAPVRGEDIFNQ